MRLQGEREIVIDAAPEAIMDALADVASVPSWSRIHKNAEVIDTHDDGRPHTVRVTFKLLGFTVTEILECQWGPDWLSWHAKPPGDHQVRYTLSPEADKTRVRFEVALVPGAPVPGFLLRRGTTMVLNAATEDLRKRVLG